MSKILVISHNVFSDSGNMGKTISSYFHNFKNYEIAQFYIHSEEPYSNICNNYYRVTDKEILKSIITRTSGTSLKCNNKKTALNYIKKYKTLKKRTILYFIRDLIWNLGCWNTKSLRKWLNDFSPDVVFLASGDYSFIYKVALKIAKCRNIPLIINCMDDYYIIKKRSFFDKIQKYFFMKTVRKTIAYSSLIMCISEKMAEDYKNFFQKKTCVIHTSSSMGKIIEKTNPNKISYIGNLGYYRYKQLISIAKALKRLNLGINCIDIYSSMTNNKIISYLKREDSINFHGAISQKEIIKVMQDSIAVIHTESFDEIMSEKTLYSVSTKIADSLMSGTCIFAYGPKNIASIKYLLDNKAAICATNEKELESKLKELIMNKKLREQTIENAIKLAEKNHSQNQAFKVINYAIDYSITEFRNRNLYHENTSN